MKIVIKTLKKAFDYWNEDNAATLAAALAYYALFAIAPLLLVVLTVIGKIYSDPELKLQLLQGLGSNFDQQTVLFVRDLLSNLENQQARGIAGVFGFIALAWAGTGLIGYLHQSLNRVWGVEEPKLSVVSWLWQQFRYWIIIIVFGSFWISSVIASSVIDVVKNNIVVGFNIDLVNAAIFIGMSMAFLVLVLQVLIEKRLAWKPLILGALITAILLFIGKSAIGWYLQYAQLASAYGAAGSVILLLLWIYYSAQIFFFGVEITKAITVVSFHGIDETDIPNRDAEFEKVPLL